MEIIRNSKSLRYSNKLKVNDFYNLVTTNSIARYCLLVVSDYQSISYRLFAFQILIS